MIETWFQFLESILLLQNSNSSYDKEWRKYHKDIIIATVCFRVSIFQQLTIQGMPAAMGGGGGGGGGQPAMAAAAPSMHQQPNAAGGKPGAPPNQGVLDAVKKVKSL